MNAIETRSGRLFNLLDPQPEDVVLEDIAHALSNLCRYTGHTRVFYSVAQHCLHVSRLVPPELALQGLLHDASEAYIGDLSSPLKRALDWMTDGDLKRLEDQILEVIFERFGAAWPMDPAVKQADLTSMMTEVRDLMPGTPEYWADVQASAHPVVVLPRWPGVSSEMYLQRFKELTS